MQIATLIVAAIGEQFTEAAGLIRGEVVELTSGIVIHPSFDSLDVLYAKLSNVRSFGYESPDQAITDFIAATLPCAVWMRVVYRRAGSFCVQRSLYTDHVQVLASVVERDRLKHFPESFAASR